MGRCIRLITEAKILKSFQKILTIELNYLETFTVGFLECVCVYMILSWTQM